MADEIFKAVKEVVGGFCVSSAKPLFAVAGEEDSSGAVRAVIYSVADQQLSALLFLVIIRLANKFQELLITLTCISKTLICIL